MRGFCVSHIDDLLLHSKTAAEHIEHLRQVFVMLRSCGLKAHPAKSLIGCQAVEFLGFDIGPNGVTPHAAKVAAVKQLPVPNNVSELKSVLGFLGYYRQFVPNYSALAAPLNALLSKDVPWVCGGDEQQEAYQAIKDQMCREGATIKALDPDRPVWVYTDWSKQGLGAVLAHGEMMQGMSTWWHASAARSTSMRKCIVPTKENASRPFGPSKRSAIICSGVVSRSAFRTISRYGGL